MFGPLSPLSQKRSIQDDINEFLAARSTAAITPLKCPLVWAEDSNAFDCVRTSAKGAYRLAAWLNDLFGGTVGLP